MNRLTALSGFGHKGPACFLLEMAGRRLILDLGEGPDAGRRPSLAGIGPVDAILISHGHADHVGALDLAGEVGSPPVHATAPVRALAAEPGLRAAHDLPFGGRAEVAGLVVETDPTGHAPGAVWTRIGGPGGLLYTGDVCAESPLFPAVPPLPAAAMICDASYGDAQEPLTAQIEDLIARARHAPLLLPAPPAGRALEMALTLRAAGIAVALCPAVRHVAQTLGHFPAAVRPKAREALAALLAGSAPLTADGPAAGAMIVAGASADSGLAASLAARFAASGEAAILFTGHVGEGSAAERLLREGKAERRRWNVHPTREGLRALLAAVSPAAVLPAFLAAARFGELAQACPGVAFSTETGTLAW